MGVIYGERIVKKVSAALLSLIVSFGTVSPVFAEETVPSAPADTESLQSEAGETEENNNQFVQGNQDFSVSSETNPSYSVAGNAATPAESSKPLEEQNTGNMQEEAGEENAGNNNNTVNTVPEVEETAPETEQNTDAAENKEESAVPSAQPSADPSMNDVQTAPRPSQSPVLNKAQMFSSQAILAELGNVSFKVEMDGEIQNDQIDLEPGKINEDAEKISEYENNNNCIFKGAYLIDSKKEKYSVAAAGSYRDKIYYALTSNQYSGVEAEEGERLVLSFTKKINIEVDPTYKDEAGPLDESEKGTVKCNSVSVGDTLEVSIAAGKYHHIESISLTAGDKVVLENEYSLTENSEDDCQLSWVVSFNDTELRNIKISVVYKRDEPYTITPGKIEHGGFCENQGNEGQEYDNDLENTVPDVQPGTNDTKFLVYTQSWTGNNWNGGNEWYLNMLLFNGEPINLPELNSKDQVQTTLHNGAVVTIQLIIEGEGLYWLGGENNDDPDPKYTHGEWGIFQADPTDPDATFRDWNKKRCIYQVTISDVQEDIQIDLNSKINSQQEMQVVKGEGIEKVGVAQENEIKTGPFGLKTEYNYSLQENDNSSYLAYYREDDDSPTFNLYFFSLKPGYKLSEDDTYTVKLSIDNALIETEFMQELEVQSVGDLFGVIKEYKEKGNNQHFDDLQYAVEQNGYEYGFAVAQNESKNQGMEIAAIPYHYGVVCDLNGGNLPENVTDQNYIEEHGKLYLNTSVNYISVEEGHNLFRLPVNIPVRDEYIFTGWKIVCNNSETADNAGDLYGSNADFNVNASNIENYAQYYDGNGDPYFEFQAQWEKVNEGETVAYNVSFYKEKLFYTDDADKYELYFSQAASAPKGKTVSIVQYNLPSDGLTYKLNQGKSTLQISNISDNQNLAVYYDIRRSTVSINRKDTGYSDNTAEREITIELKDQNNSPFIGEIGEILFGDGSASVNLENGSSVSLSIPDGFKISVTAGKVSDPTYMVSYQIDNGVPFINPISSTDIVGDTTINIIYDRQISIPTGISDMSGNMFWVIATAAIGCIFVVLLNVKKKYVKRE